MVTVGVPVHVARIGRSSIVASSPLLLRFGTPVSPVQPAPVNHPIVTVGAVVYPAPPFVTANMRLLAGIVPLVT